MHSNRSVSLALDVTAIITEPNVSLGMDQTQQPARGEERSRKRKVLARYLRPAKVARREDMEVQTVNPTSDTDDAVQAKRMKDYLKYLKEMLETVCEDVEHLQRDMQSTSATTQDILKNTKEIQATLTARKTPRDKSKDRCYTCNVLGHWSPNCPLRSTETLPVTTRKPEDQA